MLLFVIISSFNSCHTMSDVMLCFLLLEQGNSTVAVVAYVVLATAFAAVAGLIVWTLNPTMNGGVNEILCALNGIVVKGVCCSIHRKKPPLLTLFVLFQMQSFGPRQFFAQALGLAFVTASPMAVGREGPMLAIGGQTGAGIASLFHVGVTTESEMRNMIAIGLGSAIACAFGAPVGAVIFALEKGFHFTMTLMRRLFVASMLSCFLLSFFITAADRLFLFSVHCVISCLYH